MKRIDLLYISIGAFWNNSIMANYKHHDLLFKYISKKRDLRVHMGVPVQGPSHLSKLLSGSKNHVQKVWRESINFDVSADLYNGNFDAILINGSEDFLDLETPNGIISGNEINSYIMNRCKFARENNLPIIIYDQDNYINERVGSKDGSKNLLFRLFNEFKDYKKFFLCGPFCKYESKESFSNGYFYIPFTVDEENSPRCIKPFSERNYVTKYAGNNFFRDNFIPYFLNCSKYGKVLVRGSKWKSFQRNNTENKNLEVGPKFPLTAEKVNDFYSDSMIGLYGTTTIDSFRKMGHFTLRIREFFEAGTLIIPENELYMKKLVSVNNLTTDNIDEFFDTFSGSSCNNKYEYLVKEQQEKIINNFGSNKYAMKLLNLIEK